MNEKQLKEILEEVLKPIQRRLENVEKVSNLTYEQGDILEDISIRLGKLEDVVKYFNDNFVKSSKNLSADIKDTKDKVIEKVESVNDEIKDVLS